jgi:hypothetical protein
MKLTLSDDLRETLKTSTSDIQSGEGSLYYYSSQICDAREMLVYTYIWMTLKKYSFDDFKIMVQMDPFIPIQDIRNSTKYVVVFFNEEKYLSFVETIKIINVGTMFPVLSNIGNCIPVEYPLMDYSSFSGIPFAAGDSEFQVSQHIIDIFCWMVENCQGKYYRYGKFFFFETSEDAMLFKLKWS